MIEGSAVFQRRHEWDGRTYTFVNDGHDGQKAKKRTNSYVDKLIFTFVASHSLQYASTILNSRSFQFQEQPLLCTRSSAPNTLFLIPFNRSSESTSSTPLIDTTSKPGFSATKSRFSHSLPRISCGTIAVAFAPTVPIFWTDHFFL